MSQDSFVVRDASASDVASLVDFGIEVGEETYLKTGFLPAGYVTGPQRAY